MSEEPQELQYDDLHPLTQQYVSRRKFMQGGAATLIAFGGIFAFAGCGDDKKKSDSGSSGKSLYDRLGGATALTAVVSGFFGVVGKDKRINTFFANTDLDNLQKLVIDQLGEATGGPQKYKGRDMKSAHAGLKITVAAFNAFVEDLVTTLNGAKVPKKEQSDLLALLGPMQSDIVTA